ncbi:MAG: ABC transporter ATP-binding protein [bacterium]|nr:ABC transporter ATP-binding protein [bacterium]
MTPAKRLVIDDVSFSYETRDGLVEALAKIALTIEPGEFICCVGPSGCGKTTLLHLIAGFLTPTTGTMTLGATPVRQPGPDRGVVFQQPTLYPWMTVADNVAFGPRMRHLPKEEQRRRVDHYLQLVGLQAFAQRAPYELSGGMQQRVAIARVLANDPTFLLMDEPFGALDALTRERLQEELLKIWRATRSAVFFITHSAEEAVFLATRVIVMSARPGRILLDRKVGFSRRVGMKPREIRADQEFIAVREEIIERIYSSEETP